MAHSERSFFFGPVALTILVSLLCATWPATVSGKKSRRKGKAKKQEKSYEDALDLEKRMGPSEYWEEIEADNFKKKVFRKDKDVVVFFYGDEVPQCLAARRGMEMLGEMVAKTNPNIRTMRIDDLRFGLDLSTNKDIHKDFRSDTTLPRMFLVRAYEKTPIRFPQKDIMRGETASMFLMQHSSFRKEFGYDDYLKKQPRENPHEKDYTESGRVGTSKHYKELLPTDFPRHVNSRLSDLFLLHYSDKSKASQARWKLFEKAAGLMKKKTKELAFARVDVRRYGETEIHRKDGTPLFDPVFSEVAKQMPVPHGFYISANATKGINVLQEGTLKVYGFKGLMDFLQNHSSHLIASHDEL